jgi:hyperosmotically inducible protein
MLKKIIVPSVLGGLMMLMLAFSGCQTMTGQTAGENATDARITATVKSKLTADRVLNISRVDVDTEDAVVHLTGVVDTPDQKQRAEQIARQVSGVKRVVNNLHVERSS